MQRWQHKKKNLSVCQWHASLSCQLEREYLALGNVGCEVAVVAVVDRQEAGGAGVEFGVGVIRGVQA